MKVLLLHNTPLYIAAHAIRQCWQSQEKSDTVEAYICPECGSSYQYMEAIGKDCCYRHESERTMQYTKTCGPKDRELIDRVGNKHKHSSTLEHLVYTFDIEGVSRALLQELARHRMASLSVKSTRCTPIVTGKQIGRAHV